MRIDKITGMLAAIALQISFGCIACVGEQPALIPYPSMVQILGGRSKAQSVKVRKDASLGAEAYALSVRADGVEIRCSSPAGEFYAGKTLEQLRGADGSVPCAEIEDAPHFSWRGVLLDESRHFFGKQTVKRILDRMADYKLNLFHWHLVDSQGWRIQIDRYPELTKRGAVRPMPDWEHWIIDEGFGEYGPFFYTKDDIREIVAYAAARHIRVVPEIEIPGHSRAVIMCYPQFSCVSKAEFMDMMRIPGKYDQSGAVCLGNDEVIRFFENVLDEVCELFPCDTVHIGGDECPRENWKECAKCQARMKMLGITEEAGLQSWVTAHFVKYLAKKNRRTVGWDEILQGGLAPGAIVMSWRGHEGGIAAAETGHSVVMCPHRYCYLDYPTGEKDDRCVYPQFCLQKGYTLPLEKVYSLNPYEGMPKEHHKYVIGSQSLNWTEATWNEKDLEYKMWPRTCASAEVLWTGPGARTFGDFLSRLKKRNGAQ